MSRTDAFVAHRNLLFTVAYEMLGSAADSEDVLQEVWLRWAEVTDDVLDERAYLVRITTRLSLNRLRRLARRREEYVGPWLPEPLLTAPDVAEDVELADSVSTAMLLVLETLPPIERAVFVLREVFDVSVRRDRGGRRQVGAGRAADRPPGALARRGPPAARRQRRAGGRTGPCWSGSSTPTASGDLQALMDVLSPDVVLITDGGGQKQAALRPILGAEKVLRFLAGVYQASTQGGLVSVNGGPALRLELDGELEAVATFTLEGGLVTGAYIVRNPHKLAHLDGNERVLTR